MPRAKAKKEMNVVRLAEQYGSEERCRWYMEELRWPDGIKCPRCNSDKISRLQKRWQFDCDSCRYQFSPTAGTIFHDSHLPLFKWFMAIYLMMESKRGISANQMKRTLEISYKTAWYLCHRIRAALKETNPTPLKGTVEVDETWVGGRRRHVGHGYRENKTMVLGAIERSGNVRLKDEKRADYKTLRKFINEHTDPLTESIYTDDYVGYRGIGDNITAHETVNHSEEDWVRGKVHTNTVEGVFSLFKRSVVGSYHQLSAKHLDSYLDEFEFRFNNRKNPYLFRDTLTKLLSAEALPYRRLVEQAS